MCGVCVISDVCRVSLMCLCGECVLQVSAHMNGYWTLLSPAQP